MEVVINRLTAMDGGIAVILFFIISGLYMSMVIAEIQQAPKRSQPVDRPINKIRDRISRRIHATSFQTIVPQW